MKALLLCVALLLLCVPASAGVMAYYQDQGGRFVLHNETGPVCVEGAARRAEYVANDGTVTAGCWTVRGQVVVIVFFDTDVAAVPRDLFQKPKEG